MEFTKRVGRNTLTVSVTRPSGAEWVIGFKRFKAVLMATEDEYDAWANGEHVAHLDPETLPARIAEFVDGVFTSTRKDTLRAVWSGRVDRSFYVPLDGEEEVKVVPVRGRDAGAGRPKEVVAGIVVCDSPRCRTENGQHFRCLAVLFPHSDSYDPRRTRTPTGGLSYDGIPVVEGRNPDEVAWEHRAWHVENHPTHSRVKLDRWIDRHAHLTWPEPTDEERADLKKQLSLAKAETAAMKRDRRQR